MKYIDKIIFGDNQFFGINHMSAEKAQQLSEKFYDIENIFSVYKIAYECGLRKFMLNTNSRAEDICEYFKTNKNIFPDIEWYPSIPYPHKYANMVSEKGLLQTINEVIYKENSFRGIVKFISKGGSALISKDIIELMKILIDIELKMFSGLNTNTVFLLNIITDLLLGFENKEIFISYCNYIRNNYSAKPGFITMNLPRLIEFLKRCNIDDVVICSSINKIGHFMSPNINEYETVIKNRGEHNYKLMAMSIFASGAIPPRKAISYVCNQNIDSIVFGSSNKDHIRDTINWINKDMKNIR
ncbi:MAG: hypothetical protein CMG69_03825 [Candidatus Marinimicrobia bacterium]|nr:hypothetical protein [Candidatus Neomarinimicrobiota bacterium]|tara:strand:+ start:71898 stop:72794 length:897 start_codon:yes stop_codon:yes gene_type:complete